MQLSLITGLISFVDEVSVGLVNKSKMTINAKGCTFLRTYICDTFGLTFFNQIKANFVVLTWHTWNVWITEISRLGLINFRILSRYLLKLLFLFTSSNFLDSSLSMPSLNRSIRAESRLVTYQRIHFSLASKKENTTKIPIFIGTF